MSSITNIIEKHYQIDLGSDSNTKNKYGVVSFSPREYCSKRFENFAMPMTIHFSSGTPFPLIVTREKQKAYFFYAFEFLQDCCISNTKNLECKNPLTKKKIDILHFFMFYNKDLYRKIESAAFLTHTIIDAIFACHIKSTKNCFEGRRSMILRFIQEGDFKQLEYWGDLLFRDFPDQFETYSIIAATALGVVTARESIEFYEKIRGYLQQAIALGAKDKKYYKLLADCDTIIAMKKKITLHLGSHAITGQDLGKIPFLPDAICPLTKKTFRQQIQEQKKHNLPFALLVLEGKEQYIFMSALAYINDTDKTVAKILPNSFIEVRFHVFLFNNEKRYYKLTTANHFCDFVLASILATASDKTVETYEMRIFLLSELAALGNLSQFNYWYAQTLRDFPEKQKELAQFVQTECKIKMTDVEGVIEKLVTLSLGSEKEEKEGRLVNASF